jgi:uncharacterized protein
MPTKEHKSFHFEIKATDDEQGIIEGYLSVFNVVDQGNDRVLPGAFKRTIANSKKRADDNGKKFLFPMLWQHDATQPIGGVLEAVEDDYGLFTKAQFDLNTQRGREAYSGYKMGYIDQLSIGYDPVRKSYDEKGVRDLAELRLWEQSPVTFAMNEAALVTGVKSDEHKAGGMAQSKKDIIQSHIDDLHAIADEHVATARRHAKALHTAADDLATVLQGSEPAYTTDAGTPEKSSSSLGHLEQKDHSSSVDTDLDAMMAQLAQLRTTISQPN